MPARFRSSGTPSTTCCTYGTDDEGHRRRGARQGRTPRSVSIGPTVTGSWPKHRCSSSGPWPRTARFARIPERRVTFVIDSNPNYTNVCITDCQFCAFYRRARRPRSVYAHRRRGAGQDRVGGQPRCDYGPPPGRPQPRPPARVLSQSGAGDAAAISRGDATLLHRLRDPDHGHGERPHHRSGA